jgi:hypothetical protein
MVLLDLQRFYLSRFIVLKRTCGPSKSGVAIRSPVAFKPTKRRNDIDAAACLHHSER